MRHKSIQRNAPHYMSCVGITLAARCGWQQGSGKWTPRRDWVKIGHAQGCVAGPQHANMRGVVRRPPSRHIALTIAGTWRVEALSTARAAEKVSPRPEKVGEGQTWGVRDGGGVERRRAAVIRVETGRICRSVAVGSSTPMSLPQPVTYLAFLPASSTSSHSRPGLCADLQTLSRPLLSNLCTNERGRTWRFQNR